MLPARDGGQGLEDLGLDRGLDETNGAIPHQGESGPTVLSYYPAERPSIADVRPLARIDAANRRFPARGPFRSIVSTTIIVLLMPSVTS